MMGMFLGALDQTIVSTSIRTIADDLNGLSVQAWVTTAYLITSTVATPIYGKLGDLYGRKKLFMFAISVFIVGSALCSFATSMYMLAAFRAVQGIGAGGLFTLVLAIIGDIVSPRLSAATSWPFASSVLAESMASSPARRDPRPDGWRWCSPQRSAASRRSSWWTHAPPEPPAARRPHRLVALMIGLFRCHRRAGAGIELTQAVAPTGRGQPGPVYRPDDNALIPGMSAPRSRSGSWSVIVGAGCWRHPGDPALHADRARAHRCGRF
jgi:MFS family permease